MLFGSHPLAMILGAVVFVGVLAAIVAVGPGRVFHWIVSFLIPLVVILLVVVGTIGLLAHEGGKVFDSLENPLRTKSRVPTRDGKLSGAVYWLLMGLFSLASVAMVWFRCRGGTLR
jgi:hypothetical protein